MNHNHRELVDLIANQNSSSAVKWMNQQIDEIENNLNLEESAGDINLEEIFKL